MKKIIYIFFLIFLTIACKKDNSIKIIPKTIKNHLVKEHTIKRIGDYMSDDKSFFWVAKQSDSASYWVRLVFQKEFVVYQFHGQCIYYFFTNHYHTGADKIELLWSYKTDCILDMDFLRQSNGIRRFPKPGDPFCEYELVNDSLIHVKYNFPEWTKEINKINKDSIFPNYLHLEN